MARAKRAAGKSFYQLTFVLLAIVVVTVVLPIFVPAARVIFEPAYLSVVFALLSLVISLLIFGLLGDSDALIKSEATNGLTMQVTGSFAGFIIFYLLLSRGLSPFSELTIYVYTAEDQLASQSDGPIELTLAGNVKRTLAVSDGTATFAYLPKAEDRRLLVFPSKWKVSQVTPEGCLIDGKFIASSCQRVDVMLERRASCLDTVTATLSDPPGTNTTLRLTMDGIKSTLITGLDGGNVKLIYSQRILDVKLTEETFALHRMGLERDACGLLDEVESAFNSSRNSNELRILATCDTIYVQNSSDSAPKEEIVCE